MSAPGKARSSKVHIRKKPPQKYFSFFRRQRPATAVISHGMRIKAPPVQK